MVTFLFVSITYYKMKKLEFFVKFSLWVFLRVETLKEEKYLKEPLLL